MATPTMNVEGKVDLNTFLDQSTAIARSLDANTALIYNDSGKTVQYYCYNGGDFIKAVSYSKPKIAQGYCGQIAAGGSVFKVHPNDKGADEFLVKPRKAYVYAGPGKITEV